MSTPQSHQQETSGRINTVRSSPNLQMLNPTIRPGGPPGRIFQQTPIYQPVRGQSPHQQVFYRTVSPQVQARLNQNTPSPHSPISFVENGNNFQNGTFNHLTSTASTSFSPSPPMANVEYTTGGVRVLRPQTQVLGSAPHTVVVTQNLPVGVLPGQLQQPRRIIAHPRRPSSIHSEGGSRIRPAPGHVISNVNAMARTTSASSKELDALTVGFVTSGSELLLRLRRAILASMQLFSDRDNLRISDEDRACLESGMYSLPFSTPPGSPESEEQSRPPIYKPDLAVRAESIQKEIDSLYDELKNELKKLSAVPVEFVPKSMVTCRNLMNVGSMCSDWVQTYTNSLELSDYIHVRIPLINAMHEEMANTIPVIPRLRKQPNLPKTVTNPHLRLDEYLQSVKMSEQLKKFGIVTKIVERGQYHTILLATYTVRKSNRVKPVSLLRVIFLYTSGKLQMANIVAPTEEVYRNADGRHDPTVQSRFLVYQKLSVNGRAALDSVFHVDGPFNDHVIVQQVQYFQIFWRAINMKCRVCGFHLKNFMPPTYSVEASKYGQKPSFIHAECRFLEP